MRLRARPALLTVVAALVACSDGGPPVLRFQAVSAGAAHSCALETSGRAWCWGQNGTGALGTGDTAQHREPALVTGFAFTMLAAGFLHSCGLRDDGAAFCWGINGLGELGDGSRQDRWSPVAVAGGLRFVQISAGEGATCGITASDSGLYCWGTDLIGLNAPAGRDSTRPARFATGRFRAVSMGYEIACALRTGGQAICWGYGAEGQLGDGDSTSTDVPVNVSQPAPFVSISAGHDHACGQTANGAAWCWGSNDYGQLGVAGQGQPVPVSVVAGATFDSLTVHTSAHSCALRAGQANCWGLNGSGQLGDGGTVGGPSPRVVAGGTTWRQISGGFGHSCAVGEDGSVWCWGDNSAGQLGTGTMSGSLVPLLVAP